MKRVTKILILLLAVVAIVSCQKEQTYGGGYNRTEFESYDGIVPKEGGTFKLKMISKFKTLDHTSIDYNELLKMPTRWSIGHVEVTQSPIPEANISGNFMGRYWNKMNIIPPASSHPLARGASYREKYFDCPFLITNQIYSSESEDGSEYIEVTIKPNPHARKLNIYIITDCHSYLSFLQKGE